MLSLLCTRVKKKLDIGLVYARDIKDYIDLEYTRDKEADISSVYIRIKKVYTKAKKTKQRSGLH